MARITLVVNSPGAVSETFLRSLPAGLSQAGHHVTVHALRREAGRGSSDPGAVGASAGLPPVRSPRFLPAAARLAATAPGAAAEAGRRARARFGTGERAARAALAAAPLLSTRPDVVHLSFSGIAVALRDALALLDGTRVVVSCRNAGELIVPVLDPARADALRGVLPSVDAVHAVSGAMAGVVAGFGAPPERTRVIRPAIDVHAFAPRGKRPPLGEPLDLVTVGRLHWVKGIEDLLSALARLGDLGVKATLTVIGDGPAADPLRYRAHTLGLGSVVDFTGAQPPTVVRDRLEAADVFVLPSLSEGISNAVLEAMATELPVVTTLVGGMAEAVTDGEHGRLVAPGRPDELAGALASLVADPAGAAAMGRAARARVVAEFGLDRQRAQWVELYDAVLSRPAVRR